MLHSAKNAKTGSAVERRRKQRCLSYENSQTFAVVRRWLVVCPPHWLLPRIRGGQCFFSKGAAASVFCRGVRFSLPALASCGRIVRSSLTAPLLYRIKMEFLCEVFEQIENIAVCGCCLCIKSANCYKCENSLMASSPFVPPMDQGLPLSALSIAAAAAFRAFLQRYISRSAWSFTASRSSPEMGADPRDTLGR